MDYAGNSNKAKEAAETSQQRPKLEKLPLQGEVVVQKPGFGKKFRGLFFGDDFKTVMKFVVEERIVPGLKSSFYDAIIGGTERALWGDKPMTKGRSLHPGIRTTNTSYHNPSRSVGPAPRPIGIDRGTPPPRRQFDEINNVIFSSKADANDVLGTMIECIEKYQLVSLGDYYELTGYPQAAVHQKWGWTNLASAQVRQIRQGYIIDLPPLEEIQ